jgi:hypothetical protein
MLGNLEKYLRDGDGKLSIGDLPEDYLKNKDLYVKAAKLWGGTGFLQFIVTRVQYIEENTTESAPLPPPMNLEDFLRKLNDKIIETTTILRGKNELSLPKKKRFFSFPKILKAPFNVGRDVAYVDLLKTVGATDDEATDAEAIDAEAIDAEAKLTSAEDTGAKAKLTPKLYFLMLYRLGLIATGLCQIEDRNNITYEGIETLITSNPGELLIALKKTKESEESRNFRESAASSGGATSRRRRRRRNHYSLHSRKSINRNKKSKKIRKLYTSKRRVRPRNQNKPKNKSRK